MQKEKSEAEKLARRRKMHLWLPTAGVPLLALVFYALGGGKGVKEAVGSAVKGINMQLPHSQQVTKGKLEDKMTIYAQAARDSAKLAESRKQDSYSTGPVDQPGGLTGGPALSAGIADSLARFRVPGVAGLSRSQTDVQAQQVFRQIDEMRQRLALTGGGFAPGRSLPGMVPLAQRPVFGYPPGGTMAGGLERSAPMEPLSPVGTARRDPEMERLDGMLDKLLRVQHPELVRKDSCRSAEAPLTVAIAREEEEEDGGFMEITDASPADSSRSSGIGAVVNVDQTLTAGSTVELRLTHAVTVDGHQVPKDQLVYAVAALNGERLMLTINSIRVGMTIWPVALQVYDWDGLAGIRVPGAIGRDVSKESANEALNGLSVASVDPSLGAQAANAGLQFARSLAGKKVRLVRVQVPAGYRVLLKNVKR